MNWMMKYQMMIKSMNIQLEMRRKQNSFKKWMRKEEWMIKDYNGNSIEQKQVNIRLICEEDVPDWIRFPVLYLLYILQQVDE